MKLRIGGLMLVFFSLVLPAAAQDSSNTITPPYKKIVWNNTTVMLNGPNGTPNNDAPTVLQVTGGEGKLGGGIQLTAGRGSIVKGFGGRGGWITLVAGDSRAAMGAGGSVTLQPGVGGYRSFAY